MLLHHRSGPAQEYSLAVRPNNRPRSHFLSHDLRYRVYRVDTPFTGETRFLHARGDKETLLLDKRQNMVHPQQLGISHIHGQYYRL